MFARQVFRPARTLHQQVRRYASEAPKSGGSNGVLYTGIGAAGLAGAYLFMRGGDAPSGQKGSAPPSEEAKKMLSSGDGSVKKAFTGGDQGFVSLMLEKSEVVNHNTKKLSFKLPEDDMESGLPVASAVITKYKGPEMQKPAIRPYTPVSDEDTPGYIDFVVKRYPGGVMSEHLHSMTPGQSLEMKGPIPKYPWEANKHDHIALIAGGTGITPMYQLARAIFKNPEDKTKVTLVFGNVTADDILLKSEFEELENKFPNRFRAFYVLDQPPKDWPQGKGFITKELLKTVIPAPNEKDVKVFVCGPPGMYKAISGNKNSPSDQGELSGYLAELGYSKDQVFKF